MKHIVERAIGHPVCDYDWVRGGRRLTRPQHGQHIWVGEDSTGGETHRWRDALDTIEHFNMQNKSQTLNFVCRWIIFVTHLSFGYSSLKSRLFLVVHSRTWSILITISLPCQRPCHNWQRKSKHQYWFCLATVALFEETSSPLQSDSRWLWTTLRAAYNRCRLVCLAYRYL